MGGAAGLSSTLRIVSGGSPPAEYSESRLGPYFPPAYAADSPMSMKVLKPSSMNALRRSFEPTIIGNQPCPISWAVTQKRNESLSPIPSNTMPGYSIPVENPATLMAAGHGYGYHCFEKCSTVSLTYSVDLSHASGPTLSGG